MSKYDYENVQKDFKKGLSIMELREKYHIPSITNVYKIIRKKRTEVECATCLRGFFKDNQCVECKECREKKKKELRKCLTCDNNKKKYKKYCDECMFKKQAVSGCLCCGEKREKYKSYCTPCSKIKKEEALNRRKEKGNSGREHTRMLVRARDKHTCQICKRMWEKGEKRFDVHHIYEKRASKNYDSVSDLHKLITLCHKCHMRLHSGKFPELEQKLLIQ